MWKLGDEICVLDETGTIIELFQSGVGYTDTIAKCGVGWETWALVRLEGCEVQIALDQIGKP